MTDSVEIVKAANELINAQADQLWDISISVVVAEVFMIAHLLRLRVIRVRRKIVAGFIGLSALCHASSLACGYLSKGALIQAMIDYAAKDHWTFPKIAEFFNFLQLSFVSAGLLIFVVCFFVYSQELARLLVAEEGVTG